jgi:cell division protein FtsW (lipid II flippase)
LDAIFLDERTQQDRLEMLLLGVGFAILALTAVAMILAPAARLESWDGLGGRWGRLLVLPVWAGCVWLLRAALRRWAPKRDPLLLPIAMLLTGWGILTIWRLSPDFGLRQTGWFVFATLLLATVLRAPRDLRWLKRYRYVWLTSGLLLTAATLILGTNPSGGQPRLWLGCCGIYLQPSEPLRLLLIAFVASFFADRLALDWVERRPPLIPTLAPLLVVWSLSMALLLMQRDLGTGTLLLILLAVLLYLASNRWQVLLAAGTFATIGGILVYLLFDVVRIRVQALINPWADPIGGSYQIVQSLISLASGGVFGRGPGLGSPGFVPAVHTDFIFTAITEEWGLIGALAMLMLFAVLVARGLRVALRNRDLFSALLAAGLAASLGLQAVLIIGGVVRILPLTGITLPFVSYGGSSLATSFIGLGFLLALSGREQLAKPLQRPLQHLQGGFSLAWCAIALALGWWTIYRAPILTARTDNARRGLASRYVQRGQIFDRGDNVLAMSVGERGEYERIYSMPSAAHVVGFDSLTYGLSGVEFSMDSWLRGENGYPTETIWWQRLLTANPPPGLDVRLTLDRLFQDAAAEALGAGPGAVVVIDPRSGEVLALASAPSYDANLLDSDWQTLIENPDAPLLNRTTQSRYQPGMALGPFLLAWAHSQGSVDAEDPAGGITDPVTIDGDELSCAADPDQEVPTLGHAMLKGCPAPFVALSEQIGGLDLMAMVDAFGLHQSTAIRLEVAPTEDLQTPESGEALRSAFIGQGDLAVSPLQIAQALAAFWNDGVLPAVKLVDAVRLPNGTWEQLTPLGEPITAIPPETAQAMRSLLGGEGSPGGILATAIAGPEGESLAWFLGVIGEPDSMFVVVVVLENAEPQDAGAIAVTMAEILARNLTQIGD